MKDILLDAHGMTVEDLAAIARQGVKVQLTKDSEKRIAKSRKLIEQWVLDKERGGAARLLIPKTALLATVRAGPINGVACHAPQIFHHAFLAYLKTATTGPAKRSFLAAYMAEILLFPSPLGSWPAAYWLCFHSQISMMMFWGSGISPNIFLKHYTIQDKKLSIPLL